MFLRFDIINSLDIRSCNKKIYNIDLIKEELKFLIFYIIKFKEYILVSRKRNIRDIVFYSRINLIISTIKILREFS